MVLDIQSKEVIDKISDELKVQPSLEIPRQLAKDIQLVYNVNPRRVLQVVTGVTRLISGNVTMFTAPTDRDFFLTSASLNNQSDVSCDNTTITMAVTPEGAAPEQVLLFSKITLTVFQHGETVHFNPPIKIERGSGIDFGSVFTVGVSVSGATLTGYTTDPQ